MRGGKLDDDAKAAWKLNTEKEDGCAQATATAVGDDSNDEQPGKSDEEDAEGGTDNGTSPDGDDSEGRGGDQVGPSYDGAGNTAARNNDDSITDARSHVEATRLRYQEAEKPVRRLVGEKASQEGEAAALNWLRAGPRTVRLFRSETAAAAPQDSHSVRKMVDAMSKACREHEQAEEELQAQLKEAGLLGDTMSLASQVY